MLRKKLQVTSFRIQVITDTGYQLPVPGQNKLQVAGFRLQGLKIGNFANIQQSAISALQLVTWNL